MKVLRGAAIGSAVCTVLYGLIALFTGWKLIIALFLLCGATAVFLGGVYLIFHNAATNPWGK